MISNIKLDNESYMQLSRLQIAYITTHNSITAEQQEALTDTQLFTLCDYMQKQQQTA